MKYAVMAIVLAVAGYMALQQKRAAEAPPPPPVEAPPPPPPPPPMISEEEQRKIVKSASDFDPNVRWEALLLLDKLKAPMAMPVIFQKLHKDTDPQIRIKVAKLLATKKGNADVTQNLIWATKDYEPTVRVAALQGLEILGDPNAASAITDSLKDMDETVRLQALKTLNALQDARNRQIEEERRMQEEAARQAQEAAQKAKKKKGFF